VSALDSSCIRHWSRRIQIESRLHLVFCPGWTPSESARIGWWRRRSAAPGYASHYSHGLVFTDYNTSHTGMLKAVAPLQGVRRARPCSRHQRTQHDHQSSRAAMTARCGGGGTTAIHVPDCHHCHSYASTESPAKLRHAHNANHAEARQLRQRQKPPANQRTSSLHGSAQQLKCET
jgi:hypothetical protein